MKTVVAVMGSPRKRGDTYRIVNALEERLKERGDVDFRYIHLGERKLEYCRGCLLCMRKGEDACPIRDGAAELRRELLEADGIIFSSPVYVHQVTGLMKNFFDRFAFFMHRPAFHGKPAVLATSTEISGAEETLAYLRFCAGAWGLTVTGEVGILADGMKAQSIYRERVMKGIDDAAATLYGAMEHPVLPKPSVQSLQFFNKLKTKVIIHREKLPYDYRHWKERGWLEKSYFYDTRIGIITRIMARVSVISLVLAMKRKLGGDLFRRLFLDPLKSHRLHCQQEGQSDEASTA
ncbi:MAG: NAD(P)H-dependent oxidoreductase [Spirochaetes bacterium]|nr:NAD(P)H-dependent oxidoreductase [Spirochaetota bacterium]